MIAVNLGKLPAVENPYVIHAPGNAGTLCGAEASPHFILSSGPFGAIDCPGCQARLATDEGIDEALGAAKVAREALMRTLI